MYKVRGLGHAALMGAVWMTSLATSACSEDFSDCDSTRSCPPDSNDGGPDIARGGTGGASGSGGMAGVAGGNGGTSTAGGDAGAGGTAESDGGPTGTGGNPGTTGPDPRCSEGWLDCNDDLSNGCEVDPNTDVDHCGGCDNACAEAGVAERACEAGECVPTCTDGFVDCDEDGRNGCEIDIRTDVANCGACNRACSTANTSAVSCAAGACAPTCTANFGDCTKPQAPAADNGCETNVTTAQNCGTCGRNCQGGTCDAQRACTPVVLGYPEANPTQITVDSQYAFWGTSTGSNQHSIVRVSRNGGGRVAFPRTGSLLDLVSDGQWLFLASAFSDASGTYSGVYRMNRASGSVSTWFERPESNFRCIAATGDSVFWGNALAHSIWKSGRASGADAVEFAPVGSLPLELVPDATNLYVTLASRIQRIPIAGGPATDFVTIATKVRNVTVDATHVYFADIGDLKRQAKSGTQPQTLASSPDGFIAGVAVSPTRAFFLDADGLFSLPKNGNQAPVKIADTDPNPFALVYFDGALYWAARGTTGGTNGRVMKIVP